MAYDTILIVGMKTLQNLIDNKKTTTIKDKMHLSCLNYVAFYLHYAQLMLIVL